MRRTGQLITAAVVALSTLAAVCPWAVADGPDAPPPGSYLIRRHGNLKFHTQWTPHKGMTLEFTEKGGGGRLTISLKPRKGSVRLRPRRTTAPTMESVSVLYPERLPSAAAADVAILLKFRAHHWSVYINDREVARVPPPFALPCRLKPGTPALKKSGGGRQFRFQKTASTPFRADFMQAEAATKNLGPWKVDTGAWNIHTVHEDAVKQKSSGKLLQIPVNAGYSPNFYSLKGSGKPGVIVTGYTFNDDYSVAAAVLVSLGEQGVVSYYRGPSDYLALTLDIADPETNSARVRLKRVRPGKANNPEILAEVSVSTEIGQWIRLKLEVVGDRIRGYVDHTLIIEEQAEMASGGRFGLMVDSAVPIRFDDVEKRSVEALDLSSPWMLAAHTLYHDGRILARKPHRTPPRRDTPDTFRITPKTSAKPQILALGNAGDKPAAVSATFTLNRSGGDLGLITGFQSVDAPYYRFLYERGPKSEAYRLQRIVKNHPPRALCEWRRTTRRGARRPKTATMAIDITKAGVIRCYQNGELVLFHVSGKRVIGASGLYIGAKTSTRVSEIGVGYTSQFQNQNRYEKNRLFAADPFMKHWSSPKGEWIPDSNNLIWYKGDFFGRFALAIPHVPESTVHLGVEEGQSQGRLLLAIEQNELILSRLEPAPGTGKKLLTKSPFTKKTKPALLTIHYQDYWLWVMHGDQLVLQHRLSTPLTGTRLIMTGFPQKSLAQTRVDRYNVKDYLFTDAPSDWVIRGGKWQVINRFQCDPKWSHMTGESKSGTAAIWTKYTYEGDFCVELYAGIRHGWYKRCGDINLTVMNDVNSPSQGYTITLTGWDLDHSQKWTRLYRNGKMIKASDKYLIPRFRNGNKRRFLNPLVKRGRDVHGAWYYIKLRRIDGKLEYYFDNQLVLSYQDDKPIDMGSLGIWTFMNSVVFARVKIAAEKITPRQIPFKPVGESIPDKVGVAYDPDPFRVLRHTNVPVAGPLPGDWAAVAGSEKLKARWILDRDKRPVMIMTNTAGSGAMHAINNVKAMPLRELAGWRFLIKRTESAQFNFHYSIGSGITGKYTASKHYIHRISGTGIALDPFVQYGNTPIAPIKGSDSPDWYRRGSWTPVTVWLPPDAVVRVGNRPDAAVKIKGFGNLQPSNVLQGLTGNRPGAAYAVKEFTPIYYHAPALSLRSKVGGGRELGAKVIGSGRTVMADSIEQSALRAMSKVGLNVYEVELSVSGRRTARIPLVWLHLPEVPAVQSAWSKVVPDSVEFRTTENLPDRRLTGATLRVADLTIPLLEAQPRLFRAVLPRHLIRLGPENRLVATLHTAKNKIPLILDRDDDPAAGGPILTRIESIVAWHENFELRDTGKLVRAHPGRSRMLHGIPGQGSALQVFNRALNQRLTLPFSVAYSSARYPLLKFRYRAGHMANISVNIKNFGVRGLLSEKAPNTRKFALSNSFQLDDAWHTWIGHVPDLLAAAPFSRTPYQVVSFNLGSINQVDQTGRVSHIDLDDIMAGPAVSRDEQLQFTPHYLDLDGVAGVYTAIISGVGSYHELNAKARDAIKWKAIPNNTMYRPSLSSLADGIYHVLLRAKDKQGHPSDVTDIPFIKDTRPLTVSFAITTATHPMSNGTRLDVTLRHDAGAPPDLEKIQMTWNGDPVDIGTLLHAHDPTRDNSLVKFNWPYILKDKLDTAPLGKTGILGIHHLADGAGNPSPILEVPIKVGTIGEPNKPTLLPVVLPKNIFWSDGWTGREKKVMGFSPAGQNGLTIKHDRGLTPFLETTAHGTTGEIWRTFTKWSLTDYPYLAFRMRLPVLNKTTHIDVVISLSNGSNWIVPLVNPIAGRTGKLLAAPDYLAWEKNKWQSILFDIPAMLKAAAPEKATKDLKVTSLKFKRTGTTKAEPMHLQYMYVMGRYTEKAEVHVSAYDASGIAGIAWEALDLGGANVLAKGDTDTVVIVPAALTLPAGTGWLRFWVKDRVGNRSVPLDLPWTGTQR